MARAPWLIAGAAAVALVGIVMLQRPGASGVGGQGQGVSAHPDPRPGVTAVKVLPVSFVPRTPGAVEAYAAAREAAATLDGVYCHCDCSKHSGHRSLLTCFESEHGAYCDICMGEAMVAHGMAQQGRPLEEIRTAIDRQFGS
ncbi:MAG: CYCXC family (seleno)protein [Gemmatimonadota bacterium]